MTRPASLASWVLAVGASALAYRLSWRSGATDAEAFGSMPGDDVIGHPMVEWTRAGTIDARPADIWPWLVQMGFGRGGWYTDERVDRLVWGVSADSTDRIREDLQHVRVGDIIADGPDHAAYFHIRTVDAPRAIVYHSIRHPWRGHPVDATVPDAVARLERQLVSEGPCLEFSWAFVLRPDGSATRLIIRTRAVYAPAAIGLLRVPLGFVDLFHAHTIIRAIRRRAEASASSANPVTEGADGSAGTS